LCDHSSQVLFPPTEKAALNLLDEGIEPERVFIVGNTVVDAVLQNIETAREKAKITLPEEFLLLTLHRAENVDDPKRLKGILGGFRGVRTKILFPVHPRTEKILKEHSVELGDNFILMPPLGYFDFLLALERAKIVLTDSGGVQEESVVLNTPCLTLRTSTERPETVECGSNLLVGVNPVVIRKNLTDLLTNPEAYSRMRDAPNPFGDGTSGKKIVEVLQSLHKKGKLKLKKPEAVMREVQKRLLTPPPELLGKKIGELGLVVSRAYLKGVPVFPDPDLEVTEDLILEVRVG